MEWLEPAVAVITGLLLRFGLPIAVTALVVWILRTLDARWQAEAEKVRVRPHSLGADVRQVRCWETRDCPPEKRDSCPALSQPEKPCWQIFRDDQGRLLEPCLDCEVFREAPVLLAT